MGEVDMEVHPLPDRGRLPASVADTFLYIGWILAPAKQVVFEI